MSFLADPPMLVACGAAASLLPDERSQKIAERAVVATFVVTSVSLYVNAGGRGACGSCAARSPVGTG